MTKKVSVPEAPGPRLAEHGPQSGEAYREVVLIPTIEAAGSIEVDLSPAMGLPPSWCEEAFGGLVRRLGVGALDLVTFTPPGEGTPGDQAYMESRVEKVLGFMRRAASSYQSPAM